MWSSLPAPISPSLLQAVSAYTTLRLHYGQPVLWAQHHQRLAATCSVLQLPPVPELPPFEASWAACEWLLLRLTISTQGAYYSTRLPKQSGTYPAQGVRVLITTEQIDPRWGRHKTGNALPYVYAGRLAQANNAFEALLWCQDRLADGSRSSLALRCVGADGRQSWYEPTDGLPGITRAALFASQGVQPQRLDLTPSVLEQFEQQRAEWWLCGSGMGVVPIAQLVCPQGPSQCPQPRPLTWGPEWDKALCWLG